jgi:hypothetical protein
MNRIHQSEARASSSRSVREGESSLALCDRLSRTRDLSPRQLPTNQDCAVSTREYQIDLSSMNMLRLLLALSSNNNNNPTTAPVDRVTPYQVRVADGS